MNAGKEIEIAGSELDAEGENPGHGVNLSGKQDSGGTEL